MIDIADSTISIIVIHCQRYWLQQLLIVVRLCEIHTMDPLTLVSPMMQLVKGGMEAWGGARVSEDWLQRAGSLIFTHWEREVDRVAAVMMVSGEASGEGVASFVMVVWVADYPSAQREVEWMVVVLMVGCGARRGDFLCGVGLGCWAVNSFVCPCRRWQNGVGAVR